MPLGVGWIWSYMIMIHVVFSIWKNRNRPLHLIFRVVSSTYDIPKPFGVYESLSDVSLATHKNWGSLLSPKPQFLFFVLLAMARPRKNNPDKCRKYYLSSCIKSPCHDHPSNQGTKVSPMNVYLYKATEFFDFSIAWLLDLSRNAQTINE